MLCSEPDGEIMWSQLRSRVVLAGQEIVEQTGWLHCTAWCLKAFCWIIRSVFQAAGCLCRCLVVQLEVDFFFFCGGMLTILTAAPLGLLSHGACRRGYGFVVEHLMSFEPD